MAIQIQLRQGTTTEHNTFKGAVGEVTVDTTKDVPVVHDGVTVGGFPVAARANADGTISLIKKDGTSAGTINALGLFNNTLTSTNTNQALTAAQGKVLKDTLDTTVSSSFGVGQTVIDVASGRVLDTTYTNNTGKAIFLIVVLGTSGSGFSYSVINVDGVSYSGSAQQQSGMYSTNFAIIPNGSQYSVSRMGNAGGVSKWLELRT